MDGGLNNRNFGGRLAYVELLGVVRGVLGAI